VGIIALLFGISLVGVNAARQRAQRIRTTDDLHMIQIALDAYRSDFQDYPRFAEPTVDQVTKNNLGNGTWLDYSTDRGARLLCQALISPGPAGTGYYANAGEDGADGPGFRIRRTIAGGGSNGLISGKIYGPYLAADKFKLESSMANMQDAKILDNNGNPILYFPALPGPPAVNLAYSYVYSVDPRNYTTGTVGTAPTATTAKPLYNAFDNTLDTTTNKPLLGPTQMQFLLGDTNMNGNIDQGETAVTTQPYLLWVAGADGQFGFGYDPSGNAKVPTAQSKTDDVANFDFPPGVRK